MDDDRWREEITQQVLSGIEMTAEIADEQIFKQIDQAILRHAKEEYIPLKKKARLRKDIFNAIRRLDVLQELLEDDSITEIMVNSSRQIYVEQDGRMFQWGNGFGSREKYENVIQMIAAGANRIVNESSPIVDARLKDGSRVNIILSPIALDGSAMTIRKFPKEAMTMERLLKLGSLTEEAAMVLKLLVESGYNIFISGGTGSGKTTFLNALSGYIPSDERVITIEDSAELKLIGIPNLVRLEARNANVEGQNEITIRDLLKASLRARPSRIVVGEVRGQEAIDMLQALNTGHSGLSTGHANSSRDMLSRIETMALMGMDIPLAAIRAQIASAIDVIVHLGRLRDRSRRVLEVVELLGYQEGEFLLNPLYCFDELGEEAGRVIGELTVQGSLVHRDKLMLAGKLHSYEQIADVGRDDGEKDIKIH